jgi:hypothetical protein
MAFTQDPYTPREPEPPRSFRSLARWWAPVTLAVLFLVGVAVVLAASDDGGDSTEGGSLSKLELAEEVCAVGPQDRQYIVLGDGGSSLTMIGEGEETSGAPYGDIACILVALDMPDSIASQIDRTTAMMGVQQAAWDDFTASWSYHPDNGLNMIVEQE